MLTRLVQEPDAAVRSELMAYVTPIAAYLKQTNAANKQTANSHTIAPPSLVAQMVKFEALAGNMVAVEALHAVRVVALAASSLAFVSQLTPHTCLSVAAVARQQDVRRHDS